MHVNIHIFIQKYNKYVYLPRNLSRQPTDDKKLYKNSKQTMRWNKPKSHKHLSLVYVISIEYPKANNKYSTV